MLAYQYISIREILANCIADNLKVNCFNWVEVYTKE